MMEVLDEDHVEVEFIVEFPPYKMGPGDRRVVTRRIADKLYSEYGVIKRPQYRVIEPPKPVVTVRVVDIGLRRILGTDWYPHSIHVAERSLIQKYIDSGQVVDVDVPVTEVHTETGKTDANTILGYPVFREKYRAESVPTKYRVLKTFLYTSTPLMFWKGITFVNSLWDFTEPIRQGMLEVIKSGDGLP